MQLSENIHPSVAHFVPLFAYDHLPERLQVVSKQFHDLAEAMINSLPSNPETSAGLRKLLEAKDCFVRAGFAASRKD